MPLWLSLMRLVAWPHIQQKQFKFDYQTLETYLWQYYKIDAPDCFIIKLLCYHNRLNAERIAILNIKNNLGFFNETFECHYVNIKYDVHLQKLDMEFAIIVYARPSNKQNLV